jgi:hypothetical protein
MNLSDSEQQVQNLLNLSSKQFEKARKDIKAIGVECFALEEDQFSIYGEALFYSEVIEGVAYKYSKQTISGRSEKLLKLQKLTLFENTDFKSWFSKYHLKYHEYAMYLLVLESLRKLIVSDLELESDYK